MGCRQQADGDRCERGAAASGTQARSDKANYLASGCGAPQRATRKLGSARNEKRMVAEWRSGGGNGRAGAVSQANEELLVMQKNPAHWVMPLTNYSSTRYSELGQINKDNVGDLQAAWTFSTGRAARSRGWSVGDRRHHVHPHAVPQHRLCARSQRPGRVIWKYEPKQDPDTIPVMCCDTVNRGPAYAEGKIFLHQADTTRWRLTRDRRAVLDRSRTATPRRARPARMSPW